MEVEWSDLVEEEVRVSLRKEDSLRSARGRRKVDETPLCSTISSTSIPLYPHSYPYPYSLSFTITLTLTLTLTTILFVRVHLLGVHHSHCMYTCTRERFRTVHWDL